MSNRRSLSQLIISVFLWGSQGTWAWWETTEPGVIVIIWNVVVSAEQQDFLCNKDVTMIT